MIYLVRQGQTDWNKGAIKLYQDNGFNIIKTESIKHPSNVRY